MEETATTPEESLYKHAAKFGAILGAISILLVVIFYAVALSFMATFKFLALILIIGLGVVIYAGINYRNCIGGFLPYGKAFIHGFIVLAVSGLISTAFNLLLYQVIDPELGQKMAAVIMQNTEEMMRGFGAPEGSIDEAIEKMKVDMPAQFSAGGQILSFGKGLIAYLIISAITSIFVKRNVPVEM